MSEADLVRKIIKALKKKYPDSLWYKIHADAFQERGIPDIIGCHHGRFIGIEVKLPTNKKGTTEYQDLQIHRIMRAGGYATTATTVEEALRKIA